MINHKSLLAFLLLLTCPLAAFTPTEDGLYATFSVTYGKDGASSGEFTCRLFYDKAPLTVANFVGLARGTSGWVDFQSNTVRQAPFYDGIKFHRIMENFMIQGGSPNGQGTDGPGWTFPDEFDPSLKFDRPGLLAMANSGPSTNGSQFFVTVVKTDWLDSKHTIFGEVVDNYPLVEAVSKLPKTSAGGSVTVDPVRMTRVQISHRGAVAESFLSQPPLPPLSFEAQDVTFTTTRVNFYSAVPTRYYLFQSTDLVTWSNTSSGDYAGVPQEIFFSISPNPSQPFFAKVYRAHYPAEWNAPGTLEGYELTLQLGGGETLQLQGSSGDSGTYTRTGGSNPGSGTFTYTWERYRDAALVRAGLILVLSGDPSPLTYVLQTPDAKTFQVFLKSNLSTPIGTYKIVRQ